jgi:hypothetical protein
LTGDRPVASGFIPASTGFAFFQQTRPSTPTESSSRRLPLRGRLCYGLVVLVPLLSTPHRCDAVTVRYHTALHRTEADFHRSIPSLSQAHWNGRLARAARPLAGRKSEGQSTTQDAFKPAGCPHRSGRRVAGRDRLVACSTQNHGLHG